MSNTKQDASWLKTLSIGFSIISFGITLAILGYFVLTTRKTPSINQLPTTTSLTIYPPSPTPLAIPTVDPSVTANWKIYTNQKYSVSFKYPPDFSQDSGATVDYGKMYKAIFVSQDTNANLIVWMALTKADARFGHGIGADLTEISSKTIKINNYDANLDIWETDSSSPNYIRGDPISAYYSVDVNGKPVFIEYIDIKKTTSLESFNQILSTFKFLE